MSLALLDITRDGDVQVDIAEVGKLNARGRCRARGGWCREGVKDRLGGNLGMIRFRERHERGKFMCASHLKDVGQGTMVIF